MQNRDIAKHNDYTCGTADTRGPSLYDNTHLRDELGDVRRPEPGQPRASRPDRFRHEGRGEPLDYLETFSHPGQGHSRDHHESFRQPKDHYHSEVYYRANILITSVKMTESCTNHNKQMTYCFRPLLIGLNVCYTCIHKELRIMTQK